MKKIYLDNRWNELNYLLQESENTYSFNSEEKENSSYNRIGYNKDNTINFFDPSGGPFMQVGKILPGTGRVIKSIEFDKDRNLYLFNVK
jgi:hypothetical protein